MPGPAGYLPGEEIAGAAEVVEADGVPVHRMEFGHGFGHRGVHGAAVGGGNAGQVVAGEDAALEAVHDVERGADDGGVVFVEQAVGDRNLGGGEGAHDAEFAVDGVGAGEEVARGLFAQNEGARVVAGEEGGVGLAAGNALQPQGAGQCGQAGFQICVEAGNVEAGRIGHVVSALLGLEHSGPKGGKKRVLF